MSKPAAHADPIPSIPVELPSEILTPRKYTRDRVPTPTIPVLMPLDAVVNWPDGYVVRRRRGRPPKQEKRLLVRQEDVDAAMGKMGMQSLDRDPLVAASIGQEDQVARTARMRIELARECAHLALDREDAMLRGKDVGPLCSKRIAGLSNLAKMTVEMCRLGLSDPKTIGPERMARLKESWMSVVQEAAEDVLPEDVAVKLMDRLRDEIEDVTQAPQGQL